MTSLSQLCDVSSVPDINTRLIVSYQIMLRSLLIFVVGSLLISALFQGADAGNAIPGLGNGPTPFQSLFATGFSGSYNTFGSGYVG